MHTRAQQQSARQQPVPFESPSPGRLLSGCGSTGRPIPTAARGRGSFGDGFGAVGDLGRDGVRLEDGFEARGDGGSPFSRHSYRSLWAKIEKNRINSRHSLSHERGSEQSERASERVSAAEGVSEASSPEQANE